MLTNCITVLRMMTQSWSLTKKYASLYRGLRNFAHNNRYEILIFLEYCKDDCCIPWWLHESTTINVVCAESLNFVTWFVTWTLLRRLRVGHNAAASRGLFSPPLWYLRFIFSATALHV